MTITWNDYRRARRRSRQAWAIMVLLAFGAVAGLLWFFGSAQFSLAGPPVEGPGDIAVSGPGWMKAVQAAGPVPEGGAATALELLPVKGRASASNYDRAAFGQSWLDADRNGCDTRNDILRRDLNPVVFTEGSSCRVAAGRLHDPYTGKSIEFRRGSESSKAVQIDHVVALADAWQKGAQQLTAPQRQNFANDPLNLAAVDGPENVEKGAGDAATWLPANKNIRCHYVARQISVKAAYGLWVTQAEKDAMKRVLSACPSQQTIRAG